MSKLNERVVRHSPSRGAGSPDVWGIYEPDTGSIQYVCADPETRQAALIDVAWNFDPRHYRFSTGSMDQVLDLVRENGLTVEWVLDTHPHADHMMASAQLKERTGAPNAIGEKVRDIAKLWREIYHMPDAFDPDADFDRLFVDGEMFRIGDLEARVMLSPGHTLGSITYVCGDAAFTHDTLMQPDAGTSRADFPGGNADQLWSRSRAFSRCPATRGSSSATTMARRTAKSPHGRRRWTSTRRATSTSRPAPAVTDWIKRRQERDETLALPDRILAALQVNLRGGRLPQAESDGRHYLKLPVNRF